MAVALFVFFFVNSLYLEKPSCESLLGQYAGFYQDDNMPDSIHLVKYTINQCRKNNFSSSGLQTVFMSSTGRRVIDSSSVEILQFHNLDSMRIWVQWSSHQGYTAWGKYSYKIDTLTNKTYVDEIACKVEWMFDHNRSGKLWLKRCSF